MKGTARLGKGGALKDRIYGIQSCSICGEKLGELGTEPGIQTGYQTEHYIKGLRTHTGMLQWKPKGKVERGSVVP